MHRRARAVAGREKNIRHTRRPYTHDERRTPSKAEPHVQELSKVTIFLSRSKCRMLALLRRRCGDTKTAERRRPRWAWSGQHCPASGNCEEDVVARAPPTVAPRKELSQVQRRRISARDSFTRARGVLDAATTGRTSCEMVEIFVVGMSWNIFCR